MVHTDKTKQYLDKIPYVYIYIQVEMKHMQVKESIDLGKAPKITNWSKETVNIVSKY